MVYNGNEHESIEYVLPTPKAKKRSFFIAGIYEKTENATYLGGHAVKVIGWGVEYDNTEYWLMVNSWGPNWGDKGLFKIRKGTNECRVDNSFTGGVPVF